MFSFDRLHPTSYCVIVILILTIQVAGGVRARASEEAQLGEETPVSLKWSTGFDFSRGHYGLEEDTKIYYVPLGVAIDYDRFRATLSIPFLVSSGPTRIGSLETVSDSGERHGLGQLQVGGSYLFDPPLEGFPFVEISTKVTAPTETDSSLGTGLWAIALQADFFQRFGKVTPYLSAGRKFYIECGCDDRLKHRFYTSVGASYSLTDKIDVGIAYDWLESAVKNVSDAHEIAPYASMQINEIWSAGPYAVFGLSDGSPDFGVGFSLSVRP